MKSNTFLQSQLMKCNFLMHLHLVEQVKLLKNWCLCFYYLEHVCNLWTMQLRLHEGKDTLKGCFKKHTAPLTQPSCTRRAREHVGYKGLVTNRAGLQLTAEANGLCHIHCMEMRGVATSGPPLPRIHSLLLMVRTRIPSHFWKQKEKWALL